MKFQRDDGAVKPRRSFEECLLFSKSRVFFILAAVVGVLYLPALDSYFMADDFNLVTILRPTHDAVAWERVWQEFRSPVTCDACATFYRPLLPLSGAVDFFFWGLNPMGYHVTNMAVQLLNCWLAYLLVYSLTGRVRAAALAGLFIAIYPYHPKDVLWGIGRNGLLVGTFMLGSLLGYAEYLRRSAHRWSWYLFSLGSFVLALLTKETAVVVPLAILALWALFILPMVRANWKKWGISLTSVFPFFAILVAYTAFRWAIFGTIIGRYADTGIQIWDPRVLPRGLIHLTLYSLLPLGGLMEAPKIKFFLWGVAGCAGLLGVYFLVIGRKDRIAAFFALVTVFFALPIIAVIAAANSPAEFMRIQYVPSIGFCLLIAYQIETALRKPYHRMLAAVLVSLYGGLFAANSIPWVMSSAITRTLLGEIERNAGQPGTDRIVVDIPDTYYGGQLFGHKAWALELAAREPFTRTPPHIQVVHRARLESLGNSPGTVLIRWDPQRLVLIRQSLAHVSESLTPVCPLPFARCNETGPRGRIGRY